MRQLLLFALIGLAATAQEPHELTYRVEWRLAHAGDVELRWKPDGKEGAGEANLHLESKGLVARLYRVNNSYNVRMKSGRCAAVSRMQAEEGNRQRETISTFDQQHQKAFFVERDLVKNIIISEREVELPVACTHEVIGGLMKMREFKLAPGQSTTVPISDGRKFAEVRIEAQEKENITTPLGAFQTTRHEVFLMNDVIYRRKGRVFVWLTDDERRLPVQIKVRLQILIGTITLQLTKEERQ